MARDLIIFKNEAELLRERIKEDILKLVFNYDNQFNELEENNKQLKSQLQQKENIIKELEKWLKDYIKLFDKPDMLEEQTLEDLKEVLNKLQELKEDSSNGNK